jgi:hypothetical protein
MSFVRLFTNRPSNGLRALSEALSEIGVKSSRVRQGGNNRLKSVKSVGVKWGSFTIDPSYKNIFTTIINEKAGDQAINKLKCLQALKEAKVPHVPFTTDKDEAGRWFFNGDRVYCRTVLTGSAGDGIVLVDPNVSGTHQIVDAPLYTMGIKGKRREYRIHVWDFNGVQRYWVQEKKRRQGFQDNEGYDNRIRNLDHGWVFAHNEITNPSQATLDSAVAAVKTLGLNFGAVDLIETDKGKEPYVLEVNTAPGLEGQTCNFYASCIKDSI